MVAVSIGRGDSFAFCCIVAGVRTIATGTVLSGTKVAGWFKTRLVDGDTQHQFRLTADKFCPDSVDELEEGQWTFAPAPTPFEQPQAGMTPARVATWTGAITTAQFQPIHLITQSSQGHRNEDPGSKHSQKLS